MVPELMLARCLIAQKVYGHVCSIKCKKELIANLKDGSHWIGVGKEYENSID